MIYITMAHAGDLMGESESRNLQFPCCLQTPENIFAIGVVGGISVLNK